MNPLTKEQQNQFTVGQLESIRDRMEGCERFKFALEEVCVTDFQRTRMKRRLEKAYSKKYGGYGIMAFFKKSSIEEACNFIQEVIDGLQ